MKKIYLAISREIDGKRYAFFESVKIETNLKNIIGDKVMETYNYKEAVENDIKEYIENWVDLSKWVDDLEGLREKLYEDLWIEDSVTGNLSGSYTFSHYEAEENLCHNWELLEEALEEFECDVNPVEKGPEWCDVTIRCYLLREMLDIVLQDLEGNEI